MLLIKFLPGRESQPAQNFLEGRILRNDLTGEIREVFGSFFFFGSMGVPAVGNFRRRSQKSASRRPWLMLADVAPPASEEYCGRVSSFRNFATIAVF